MPAKRTVKTPCIVYTPKTELDTQAHPLVETQLKKLKLTSRLLHEQLPSMETEARILERLYYKSKNQHRSAKFWAKVSELRRYTMRVVDVGLAVVIDNLRLSFYGEASQRNSKVLKGSWTHYPGHRTILHSAERLTACVLLIDEFEQRLINAHRWFTVAMESMYFMDLLLTMGAITSRLLVLIRNFRPSLAGGAQACEALLSALHPLQLPQSSTTNSSNTNGVIMMEAMYKPGTSLPDGASRSPPVLPTLSKLQPLKLPRELLHLKNGNGEVTMVDLTLLQSRSSLTGSFLGEESKAEVGYHMQLHSKVQPRESASSQRRGHQFQTPGRATTMKVKKHDVIDDIFGV